MEALTSLSCMMVPNRSGKDKSFTSVMLLGQSNIGFLWSPGSRKLHSDSCLTLCPNPKARFVIRSHMASGSEVVTEMDSAVSAVSGKEPLKTVRVKFQLTKQCKFGEQFLVVGDDPSLGFWHPTRAASMKWSDGDIWSCELDVPIGLTVQYKYILKGSKGDITWQPGPDRIFKSWDSTSTIIVDEHWESPKDQKILEDQIKIADPTRIQGNDLNLANMTMGNLNHKVADLTPNQEKNASSGSTQTKDPTYELTTEENIGDSQSASNNRMDESKNDDISRTPVGKTLDEEGSTPLPGHSPLNDPLQKKNLLNNL